MTARLFGGSQRVGQAFLSLASDGDDNAASLNDSGGPGSASPGAASQVGHCEAAALAKRSIQDPSRAHLWVVSAMRAADSAALPWMSMLLAPAASTAQWRDAPVVMLTGRVAGLTTIPCGRTLTPTWPALSKARSLWTGCRPSVGNDALCVG